MAMIINQSEESKEIKRYNQQLADIAKYADEVDSSNTIVTPWSKAIRESGLEYTKEGNRYKIRNTKDNQRKLTALREKLDQYKPQTVGEIKAEAKTELKKEAEKKSTKEAETMYPDNTKKAARQREKYIRRQVRDATTGEKVRERVEQKLDRKDLSSRLDVVYAESDLLGKMLGRQLRRLLSGKKRDEINVSRYNYLADYIIEQAQRLERGELTAAELERKEARRQIEGDYAFAPLPDGDGEVTTSGKLGADTKRAHAGQRGKSRRWKK